MTTYWNYHCKTCDIKSVAQFPSSDMLSGLWKVWPVLRTLWDILDNLPAYSPPDPIQALTRAWMEQHEEHQLEMVSGDDVLPLDPTTRWQDLVPDSTIPFVKALARDATDFACLGVFADWLEEHGHTDLGTRFRKLMPREGDLLVYQTSNLINPVLRAKAAHEAEQIAKRLCGEFGTGTSWLILSQGTDLSTANEEDMRRAGWVRASRPQPTGRTYTSPWPDSLGGVE